jgi:hypothetical protein
MHGSKISLLDHLVSAQQHRSRDGKTECLRGFQVDKKVEFVRLVDRKIACRFTFRILST